MPVVTIIELQHLSPLYTHLETNASVGSSPTKEQLIIDTSATLLLLTMPNLSGECLSPVPYPHEYPFNQPMGTTVDVVSGGLAKSGRTISK